MKYYSTALLPPRSNLPIRPLRALLKPPPARSTEAVVVVGCVVRAAANACAGAAVDGATAGHARAVTADRPPSSAAGSASDATAGLRGGCRWRCGCRGRGCHRGGGRRGVDADAAVEGGRGGWHVEGGRAGGRRERASGQQSHARCVCRARVSELRSGHALVLVRGAARRRATHGAEARRRGWRARASGGHRRASAAGGCHGRRGGARRVGYAIAARAVN